MIDAERRSTSVVMATVTSQGHPSGPSPKPSRALMFGLSSGLIDQQCTTSPSVSLGVSCLDESKTPTHVEGKPFDSDPSSGISLCAGPMP